MVATLLYLVMGSFYLPPHHMAPSYYFSLSFSPSYALLKTCALPHVMWKAGRNNQSEKNFKKLIIKKMLKVNKKISDQ